MSLEIETDHCTSPAIHAPRTVLPIHQCIWLDSSAPEEFLRQPTAITLFQPVEIRIQPEIQAAFDLMALATPPKRRAIDIEEESSRDNKRSRTRSSSPALSVGSVKVEFDEAEWEELAAARATGHYHPYSPSPSPASPASHVAGIGSVPPPSTTFIDSVKLEVDEDERLAGRATDEQQVHLQEANSNTSNRLIKPLPSRVGESKPFSFRDLLPLRVLYGAPTNPLPPIQSLGGSNSHNTALTSTPSVANTTTPSLCDTRPFSFADFVPFPLLYGGRAISTFDNDAELYETDSEYSNWGSEEDDFEMDAEFEGGGVPMMREDPFDRQGVF